MKIRLFCVVLVALGTFQKAVAIPDTFIINGNGNLIIPPVIPATPRFNADLTRPFLNVDVWENGDVPGSWVAQPGLGGETIQKMSANPVLFGAVPYAVSARSEAGSLQEITINYLDAGPFFGFKLGGEKTHADRQIGNQRRSEFAHQFDQLSRNLTKRLEGGCGPPKLTTVGRSNMLRMVYKDYRWEEFLLRLSIRPNHSISLSLLREGSDFDSFLDDEVAAMSARQRSEQWGENVIYAENGDLTVSNIPMFSQGNTPFCGIHSLAMVGHYLGLRMPTDVLESSANLRNTGSARGADIMGLYHATAEEVDLRVQLSSRFDARRIAQSLEKGLPVIVWRRVSAEREQAHRQFAEKFARNPGATLPTPSKSMIASWPEREKKGTPSHASIVSGINLDRHEAILTEPWGEDARGRRIRLEELTATTYAAFYFRQ
ncbi:MAG: hypothetical protein AAGH89_06830 [Verrucomicrobiota bacterium]